MTKVIVIVVLLNLAIYIANDGVHELRERRFDCAVVQFIATGILIAIGFLLLIA